MPAHPSSRLAAVADALPLQPYSRVLEIGFGPGQPRGGRARHQLAGPPGAPITTTTSPGPGVTFETGGDPAITTTARKETWRRTLKFLDLHLARPSRHPDPPLFRSEELTNSTYTSARTQPRRHGDQRRRGAN